MTGNSLTQQQIDTLFTSYRQTNSVEERNRLYEHYSNIPSIIARRFVGRGIELDDLVQVASMSLLKALDRFDVDRGIKFQSFVVPTIVGEIKNYFRDHHQTVKISRKNNESIRKIKLVMNELMLELGQAPTTKQIARRMNIDEETVLELLETIDHLKVASLEALKTNESEGGQQETIGDLDHGFDMVENRDILKQSLKVLDEKEKFVIIERFFHNKSQQVIADKLGVSQMYVSRAEKRALEKMRQAIKE